MRNFLVSFEDPFEYSIIITDGVNSAHVMTKVDSPREFEVTQEHLGRGIFLSSEKVVIYLDDSLLSREKHELIVSR